MDIQAVPLPPAYGVGSDVPAHSAALFELRCHVAALVSLLSAENEGTSAGARRNFPSFTKRSSIHFSLPTRRDLPLIKRVEDDDRGSNSANYELALPFAIPLPTMHTPLESSSVAYQYHSKAVLTCMRKLATVHPSPEERSQWSLRADFYEQAGLNIGALEGIPLNFEDDGMGNVIAIPPSRTRPCADHPERDSILCDFGKGFAMLVGAPLLAGTVAAAAGLAATGVVLYGAGKTLVGMGRLMTCGRVG